MFLIQACVILLGIAIGVLGVILSQNLIISLILLGVCPCIILFGALNMAYVTRERANGPITAGAMLSYSLPKTLCCASFVAAILCGILGWGLSQSFAKYGFAGAILLVLALIFLMIPIIRICRKNQIAAIIFSAAMISFSIILAAFIIK